MELEIINNLLIPNFKLFLAMAFRIGGLLFTAPFLGHRVIHFLIKAGLIFLISLILLPISAVKEIVLPDRLPAYTVILAQEALIGVLIGFLFYLIFWGIEMGGSLLSLQLNLEQNISDEEQSPISRLQVFLGVLIFLALNGHHLLISAIFQSFSLIPIGELKLSSLDLDKILGFSGSVFIIALKISAPVIITLFIVDLLLGIVGKTTPQSNLFLNFMPVRIGAGLLILALSFPVFGTIIEKLLLNTNMGITQILKDFK